MNKGFTLLELLVVIGIIGILAGVVLVSFPSATKKAKLANALTFSDNVRGSLQPDMVAWWKFDETSGTVASDSWWNQLDGTVSGATWVEGIKGNALSFDGSADYVSATITTITSPQYTISSWVKIDPTYPADNGRYIVCFGATGGLPCFSPHFYNSNQMLIYLGSSNYKYGNKNLNDGLWHHVVFIVTGSGQADINNAKIYVDSIQISYASLVNSGPNILPTTTFRIGSGNYKGLIDDVQIYSAALPVAVIQQLYADGLVTHQNLAVK